MNAKYVIPKEICTTFSNKNFLLFDSGQFDAERIVIFGTMENILHLKHNNVWLCDATFQSCPKNFEQLFIIVCKIRNKNIPLLFCFMKKKNIICYNRIFNYLKDKQACIGPKHFVIDFEAAMFSSIHFVFENSKLYGVPFILGRFYIDEYKIKGIV
jgi:hypothetical protein